MAFRITTNGLFRSYANSIRRTNNKVNETMERVQTTRVFSSYAEDPSSAAKAFRLRRDYWRIDDYTKTSTFLVNKFELAWTAAGAIVNGDDAQLSLDGIYSALSGISDSSAGGRRALGDDLVAKSASISMALNTRYNGEYIFAGADGLNVPFTWDGDTLLYRGVDVSAAEDTAAYGYLQQMDAETTYVDVGLGMQEDENGNLITNTAVDSAISGLSFLGYGADENGIPNNMAVIMRELGRIYQSCDAQSGQFASSEDKERAHLLLDKLYDSIDHVQQQHVEISSRSSYVKLNMNQLEDTQYTLGEQIDEIEQMNPARAISEMMWAQYAYQAALRVGNDILSQSLFDYMR